MAIVSQTCKGLTVRRQAGKGGEKASELADRPETQRKKLTGRSFRCTHISKNFTAMHLEHGS